MDAAATELSRLLDRILVEIPEFRPIADEQLALSDGEYYSTRFFDAFSSDVMERQGRIMEGMGTYRDAAIVEIWLGLGEEAMCNRDVASTFMQTAGDDLLYDPRGRALSAKLGPRLADTLEKRRARVPGTPGTLGSWPPPDVQFGCDYCADQQNFHYGHVTQIASSDSLRRILLKCPRCGTLYENTATGHDHIHRLTPQQARHRFGEPT